MKRTKLAASFLLAGTLLLTGCVSKKELVNLQTDYNKLKDEKTALDKSYQDAQIQLAEYRTQSKSLEDRLNEARKNNQELRNNYATLQGSLDKSLQQNSQGNINISKLVDEINASNRYIKQLVDIKSKSDSLNVVLTNNLTRSLSREELKRGGCKGLERRGLHLLGRQYAIQERQLRNQRTRWRNAEQDCQDYHRLQGLRSISGR